MQWDDIIESYLRYLNEEKFMSENSINAYGLDVRKFARYCIENNVSIGDIRDKDIKDFMKGVESLSMSIRTESKILSCISTFMKYLLREGIIDDNPMELIEYPKVERRKLVILSVEEIDSLLDAVDLNKVLGYRSKAIIETLYSCGLKASELVNLKVGNLHFQEGFIEIEGSSGRLIPVFDSVKEQIKLYLKKVRTNMKIKPGFEEILFLNNRGEKMSRVLIHMMLKNLGKEINLKNKVAAQTLRDSFAVHLLQSGAPVEAVQKLLGHKSALTTEVYVKAVRELGGN